MYEFLKEFTEYINNKDIITLRNHSSETDIGMYGVLTNPVETSLSFGTQIYFDIYIWANEDTKYEDVIKVLDSLKKEIDHKHFNNLLATTYVENIKPVEDRDYKKIKAQISCSARIMR